MDFSPATGGIWTGTGVSSAGVFTPSTTGNFVLTYTYTNPPNSCVNSDTMKVKVISPEVANAGTGFTNCLNDPDVTLTGFYPSTGGSWSGIGVTGNIFKPSTVGSYNLTYTFGSGTCLSSDTIHVKVNALPVVSSTSQTICSGQSASLTASGADTYEWSTSSTSNPLSISPIITTDYTVTGTTTLTGCTNTATGKVTVNPLPVVNAGPSISLCNQPIANTLMDFSPATGGIWTGTGVSSSGVFTPSTTGSFILTYSYTNPSNSCVNSDTMKVTVVAPEVANAGTGFTNCLNDPDVTLTGFYPSTGGSWSGIGVTGNIFKPSTVGSYNLTYTFGSGTCLSSDTIHVKVNALPVVSSTSQTICSGQSANLTASGGDSYIWTSPNSASNPLTISPTITTSYIVTGKTQTTGCTNTATGIVTVNPLPVLNEVADVELCNQPIGYQLIGFTPGGTWSGSRITSGGEFTPNGVGDFDVVYTLSDINNCTNEDFVTISVIDPTLSDAGEDKEICLNEPDFQLSGSPSGGTWSGLGVTTGGLFTPSQVGDFELTYSFGSGTCLTRDTMIFKVKALPSLIITNSSDICINDSILLSISGAHLYNWSPLSNLDSISTNQVLVYPTTTTSYNVLALDTLTGCENSISTTITVNPLPILNEVADIDLCNQPIAYQISGHTPGGNWSGFGITAGGQFTPNGEGIFEVVYSLSDINSCINSDTVNITVVAPTQADAGVDTSLCFNDDLLQLLGQPSLGSWSGSNLVSNTGIFTPSQSGVYQLIYSTGSGTCLTRDTMSLTVNTLPIVDAGEDLLFCEADSTITLNGAPVNGYWTGSGVIDSLGGVVSLSQINIGINTLTYWYQDPITTCENKDSLTIQANPLPIVDFILDSVICLDVDYLIQNTSVYENSSTWNFGNGENSIEKNPVVNYNLIGFYDVKLIVSTEYGCIDSLSKSIEVREPPRAFFTPSSDSICAPAFVDFENFSIGVENSYDWDFGNGELSQLTDPQQIFFEQGYLADTSYFISLTATNLCGQSEYIDTIKVMPLPISVFGSDYNEGCSPLKINFVNNSRGLPDDYIWDFGDNFTDNDTSKIVEHVFVTTVDTIFTISLITQNECGSDTSFYDIEVHPNTVTSFFNTNNTSGCSPLLVDFTQLSTGGTVFNWTFGDGNVSSSNNPSHTFTTPGVYEITLYVNNGCSFDTSYASVEVYPKPVIDFTFVEDSLCINKDYYFINQSIDVSGFEWDFGGNIFSSLTNPIISFDTSGIHQVELKGVSNTYGCIDSITKNVYVKPYPIANFFFDSAVGCIPFFPVINNTSVGSSFYSWDLGNGSNSVNNQPSSGYYEEGYYDISLMVENNEGCFDSIKKTLRVLPKPTSDFDYTTSDKCYLPLKVYTENLSIDAIAYKWDFGNGHISLYDNDSSSYASSGDRQISLVAFNSYTCSDTIVKPITVNEPLSIELSIDDLDYCQYDYGVLNANMNFGDSVNWFLNGTLIGNSNPLYLNYNDSGTLPVQVILYGNEGCSDTSDIAQIKVYPKPVADFSYYNVKIDNKPNGTIQFSNSSEFSDSFLWNFGDGQYSNEINPIHRYLSNENQYVTLYAINDFGCRDTVRKLIDIDFYFGLSVPLTMYPEHSKHDVANFVPKGVGLEEYEIWLFDAWGNLIWYSNEIDDNGRPTGFWNGNYTGKSILNNEGNGTSVQQDVYVWKVRAQFRNGVVWSGNDFQNKKNMPTGTLTVIR